MFQAAIVLGLSLQRKDVQDVADELDLPVSQALALYNKAVRKFSAAILPALGTFAVGGPLVYSLPVVLGAALRNVGVLAMCVYLALVASSG